jgi:hypothetical protein
MKINNKIFFLIILGIGLSLFTACEKPQDPAVGYDHIITVVCDDENWTVAEPILNETLGKVYDTPQAENLYSFHRIEPGDLPLNIKNKNLLIITRLEVYSEVTGQVRSMLPDSVITRIRERPTGYYYQEDAYAKGQALVMVVAKSYADLRNRLSTNQDQIFNFVEKKMYERNTAFVYRSGEQFEMAQAYYDEHGYYLRMMHDYVEIENSVDNKVVWLGRDFPYRWLSVSWTTPDDSTELETQLDKLLEDTYQNRLGNISINVDYTSSEEIWFKAYSAVKYNGLWESNEDLKGGPFIAYGFYEPGKDRLYLLSGVIHAPEKLKIPYIRQMETIFHTFDTKPYEVD